MPASLIIDNLENGQEILLPFEVSGSSNGNGNNVTVIAWQIDEQDVRESDTPNSATATFDFNISMLDCMLANAWYMLTVYVWDATGAVTTETRTFKRVEAASIVPPISGPIIPPGGTGSPPPTGTTGGELP